MSEILSKSSAHVLVKEGKVMEVFTHETMGTFNVTQLRGLIAKCDLPIHRGLFRDFKMVDDIQCDALGYLFQNRDIDREHAVKLTREQLVEPAIIVECPPGANSNRDTSHLIIDGIHRIYRRKQLGKPDYYFHLVPLPGCPMVPKWAVEVSRTLRPDLEWGRLDCRPDGIFDRITGERIQSDIPGFFENGKRVDANRYEGDR